MVPRRNNSCPCTLTWFWQAVAGFPQLLCNFSWVPRLSTFIWFAGNTEHSQLQLKSGRTVLLTQTRFFQGSVLCLCSWDYFSDDSCTSRKTSGGERTLAFVEPSREKNNFLLGKGPLKTQLKILTPYLTGLNKIWSCCSLGEGVGQLHRKTGMGALN